MVKSDLVGIIKDSVVTTKTQLLVKKFGKVVLKVCSSANKISVKKAFELVWPELKVKKVAIMNTPFKPKKFKGYVANRPGYKKAIISVFDDSQKS